MNEPIIAREKESDVLYLQILRQTIQGLDNLRIQTIVAGLTFTLGLISASAFAWKNINPLTVNEYSVPLSDIIAFLLAFFATILCRPFIVKIKMFNTFIRSAVAIAVQIEGQLISDPAIRLTCEFEKCHGSAGRGGDFLFKVSLWIMQGIAIIASVFYGWQFFMDF